MKRLSIFFAALMACTLSFAETVTFDATKDKAGSPATTLTKDGITLTIGDGTLANGQNYRIYQGKTLTITSTIGDMTSVEFTCTAKGTAKYGPGCFEGNGYVAGTGNTGTWTGTADKITLTAKSAQVRATKIVVTYTPAAADAVKKPTFTPDDGDFVGSVEVSLAAEEGLDIYYTLDNTDPTTTSTKYAAPFTLTETTTIKAIAYDATASKASAVAEKTYTAQKLMTCAEANVAANGTTIILGEVTVAYVNGANTFVKDETGYTLVYKYDFGLEPGQVVKGIKGSMSIYNALPEIVPSVTKDDLTITEGTIPTPEVISEAPTLADVNKYVRLEGVAMNKASFTTAGKQSVKGTFAETELTFYNTFKIAQSFEAANYNIIGFVSAYKTMQIAVVSAEGIINWELNGGKVAAAVPTNAELWEAFKPYYNEFYSLKRADQPIDKVSTFAPALMQKIMTDETSEYKWLGDYIYAESTAQEYTLSTDMANATESPWRWSVHAFFNCAPANSLAVKVAGFETAGKPEAWGAAYQAVHETVLPTSVSDEYTLPTPTKMGATFLGWFDNEECDGKALTTIPANYAGTLYASWKEVGTSVEDINTIGVEVKKIVRDGQVLIVRDGKTYDMMGQMVE